MKKDFEPPLISPEVFKKRANSKKINWDVIGTSGKGKKGTILSFIISGEYNQVDKIKKLIIAKSEDEWMIFLTDDENIIEWAFALKSIATDVLISVFDYCEKNNIKIQVFEGKDSDYRFL